MENVIRQNIHSAGQTIRVRCEPELNIDINELKKVIAGMEGMNENISVSYNCDPQWRSVVDEFQRKRYGWITITI